MYQRQAIIVSHALNPGPTSVALEHAVHKISQRAPEILAAGKIVLVDEENVMLEARIEVCLESELSDDGIVMAVYVGIDTVHSLENLSDHARERLGEWDAC